MNVLQSQVKKKNSLYFDIADLYYILTREVNENILDTGILINPIVVYRIEYVNYSKDGLHKGYSPVAHNPPRFGVGGVPYIPGCLGKTYIVHQGNSRVPAALKLGYTHIEGIIDEGNTFTL